MSQNEKKQLRLQEPGSAVAIEYLVASGLPKKEVGFQAMGVKPEHLFAGKLFSLFPLKERRRCPDLGQVPVRRLCRKTTPIEKFLR
ncbi:MAG: hypothetical protein D6715_14385 [Calditrichaeota bacterium]|nr:MAG: hypothetical protein D6715_14385 [Calditrichota bacterium]